MRLNLIKCFAFTITILAIHLIAFAQKLPGKQETSLLAPKHVKIDGKANEWNDQFQAYNSATEVFYSIANDADNLYLVVRATKAIIAKKIINQGMVLTFNSQATKDIKNSVAITYPLLHNVPMPLVTGNLNNDGTSGDSVIRAMNEQLADKSKEIKVTGCNMLTDSLLSVYNNIGIKAASAFNNEKAYTCELAIPLKMLGLQGAKFNYNLKINGVAAYGVNAHLSSDGKAIVMGNRVPGEIVVEMVYPREVLASYFSTDFWGEYTLAK